jgi:pimeloyl-ACP methyl ester carboxylesterase
MVQPMPIVDVNEIQIAYETFGDPQDPPLILIMGLVTQMIGWPETFCRLLARSGLYVVRFDNRDVGLSSKMISPEVPDLERLAADLIAGKPPMVPYRLEDMAADTWGLMSALGIDRASVCSPGTRPGPHANHPRGQAGDNPRIGSRLGPSGLTQTCALTPNTQDRRPV